MLNLTQFMQYTNRDAERYLIDASSDSKAKKNLTLCTLKYKSLSLLF